MDSNQRHLDSQDRSIATDPVLSAAEVRTRCAERLEHLGIRRGISVRRLRWLLSRREGRGIKITYDGVDGHLPSYPTGVSARIDRRREARRILIWIADARRTARAKHCLFHELAHLIVEPGSSSAITSALTVAPTGSTDVPRFQCGCSESVEREVEVTAELLKELTVGQLAPASITVSSGPGAILARRGGSVDVL